MSGRSVTRGNKQDYATHREFVRALEKKLGATFTFDAAAVAENAVCPRFSSDSLSIDWPREGLIWLNPPFGLGAQFAAKSRLEAGKGSKVVGLFLASTGSNWFAEHVAGQAAVIFLRPRLTFVGCDQPFNRDLILIFWGFGIADYSTWDWRHE